MEFLIFFMSTDWLDTQFDEMVALVERWSNINSFSRNGEGLAQMAEALDLAYSRLKPDEKQRLPFQNGTGLIYRKRAEAPIQIFLGGHFDTVFAPESSFQKVTYLADRMLQGPGVIDMKGGLVVLLKALEALEKEPFASNIGWTVCLNPDEEIGSPYSTSFIRTLAKGCHFALLFEPTLSDGAFVSSRPGSFACVGLAKGKEAHAGRDPDKGINAIYPLARFIVTLSSLHHPEKGEIVNVGTIKGGKAPNIIPGQAECAFIVRAFEPKKLHTLEEKIRKAAQDCGIKLEWTSRRPPKQMDAKTEELFALLKQCAQELGISIKWRETGGVTDGNTLAHEGVPVIDTMGVRGGKAHTEEEFIHLDSLLEKTKLTLLLLETIAKKREIDELT